ncbi:MAG: phage tail protein [Proteobacteria bacterium]|nr:phage tail protein [Pseudomonadota bacterium]
MLRIDVKTDVSRALEKLQGVKAAVKEKAVVRALNEVADQAKVRAAREIRAQGYNLKAATIKKAITITRAKPGVLVAVVRAVGRPVPLIQFDGRQDRKGRVTVKVKGGRKIVKDAFIATMPTGHRGIYVRQGDTHKKVRRNDRVRWYGLPIHELYGPSIPAVFGNQVIQEALEALVREKLPRILQHEIAFLTR